MQAKRQRSEPLGAGAFSRLLAARCSRCLMERVGLASQEADAASERMQYCREWLCL